MPPFRSRRRAPQAGAAPAPGSRPDDTAGPGYSAGPGNAARPDGFGFLSADDVYLDAACQSLRPAPVQAALTEYFTSYGACGDRVQYAWGRRVEDAVATTRGRTLAAFGLSPRRHVCAFTLNTTYGLNLLLQQLPTGRYARLITTHHEHNAVFLSTMTAARRLGIPRTVVERAPDGTVDLAGCDLTDALVVVSAMDNVTGTLTRDLRGLVAAVQKRGGAVILDAAQAAPHALPALRGLGADAICFSGHKMYAPALGIVLASRDLLGSLDLTFVGGGQVDAVTTDGFTLSPDLHTRLEPGLQAWGEIIAFGAALEWLTPRLPAIEARERELGARLFDGLGALPNLRMFSPAASAVVTIVPERVDAHRLAVFLSKAGVMVRGGHFCAHHWLQEREQLPALVRFSVGAQTTGDDVTRALEVMGRMMRGL